jgi:serine/threonine-protein kinase
MIGRTIGPYAVVAKLGEGGMGEVFRARDPKLKRDVAIKILPAGVSGDPDRLARFEREAQLLASLNHPNIAQVFGFESADGLHALVMEFVPGETLDELLERPMAIPDALAIARQIASALEAAHELGIVHRDLKPANVKIRPDGTVKVLDFGLAKALEPTPADDPALLATITSPAVTARGVILGTAAYMSPEQARGQPVDRRADVWAFGVVLYEMLTGRRAFSGNLVTDVIAAVLRDSPPLDALPADTPPAIRRLVRRCLEKDRRERLSDLGAARLEIKDALEPTSGDGPVAGRAAATAAGRRQPPAVFVVGLVLGSAAVAGVAGWVLKPAPPPTPAARVQFRTTLPAGLAWSRPGRHVVAISPDGTRIAYAADRRLWTRSLDELEGRPVPGVTDPSEVFFSPDGEWVGYWSAGQMRKVALSGGAPVALGAATNPFGASWRDGHIYYGLDGDLYRVSENGGQPELLVKATSDERLAHPSLLPDGRTLMFTRAASRPAAAGVAWGDAEIVAEDLSTHERRVLVRGGTDARHVGDDMLIYGRSGSIVAARVDLDAGAPGSAPVTVLDGVAEGQGGTGMLQFAVSATGTLVTVGQTTGARSQLVWLDARGGITPILSDVGSYGSPRFSPDGKRLSFSNMGLTGTDLFTLDLARNALTQFTSDPTNDSGAIWTPDGTRLVFGSSRHAGVLNLYIQPADGSREPQRLTSSSNLQLPWGWAREGRTLIYTEGTPGSTDILELDIEGPRVPRPVLATSFDERQPALSPDGRWLAYQSNELGAVEVLVRPYPDTARARYQISVGGGTSPLWSRDGRALYFRQGDSLFRCRVTSNSSLSAGVPERVATAAGDATLLLSHFDLLPDGSRFALVRPVAGGDTAEYRVIVNWLNEVRAKLGRVP